MFQHGCWHWGLVLILSFAIRAANAGPDASVQITNPELAQAKNSNDVGDYQRAIRLASAAITKLKRDGVSDQLVIAYILLGGAYTNAGHVDEAYAALQQGSAIAHQLPDSGRQHMPDLYHQYGVYFDRMGDGDESLLNHRKALALRIQQYGQNHPAVAESYFGLGELHLYTILDYGRAHSLFQDAIRILSPVSGNDFKLYKSHYNLAQANRYLGDFDEALSHAFKARSLVENAPVLQRYLERCYSLLADIYYSGADFTNAIEFYRLAIKESIRIDGLANPNLIVKYTNLGVAYGETGKHADALTQLRRSKSVAKLHHHSAHLSIQNDLHIGRIHQKAGSTDSAYVFLRKYTDEQISAFGPGNPITADGFRYLAKYFLETGQYDSASVSIQRALISAIPSFEKKDVYANPQPAEIGDRYHVFQLFGDKGLILMNRYLSKGRDVRDLRSALESFKVADALMQVSRRSYVQDGSKLFLADHYHDIYENALRTCAMLMKATGDRRYVREAFAFMENSKAFLLAEALDKAEILSRAGVPDSLRNLERSLAGSIAAYRSQLEHSVHHADEQAIQSRIFEAVRTQERLRDTIARRYPNYFQIKYHTLTPVEDVQAYVRNNRTSIIEFFWGDSTVYALAITPEELVLTEIGASRTLITSIESYAGFLQLASWKENDQSFAGFAATARHLYATLLGQILENVNTENIIIIRDGPLLRVPFDAMLSSDEHAESGDYRTLDYLIRDRNVSYAHSADLLLKKAARLKPSSADKKVLAFSYSPALTAQQAGIMSELPGAAHEVNAIARIWPGTFLMGDDATEHKFKSMAGDYDILHLAVHGKSDPEKQFSGTLFFRPQTTDDGQLHLHELYDLVLKARLTVLSACESGVGKVFKGEGVFGIARGFAYAGCPTTVVTLWSVGDETSSRIMSDFYAGVREGERIDAALRNAKLNFLAEADPLLAHPSYWAGYIPTGNMDPIVPPAPPLHLFWISAAAIAGALIYVVVKMRKRARSRR